MAGGGLTVLNRHPNMAMSDQSAQGVTVRTFTAYLEWDTETNLYVGSIPGIPGAHSQGATLDELHQNLKEVLVLCLEEYKGSIEDLPNFVGTQQIEIAV